MKLSTLFLALLTSIAFLSGCTGLTEEIPTPETTASVQAPVANAPQSPTGGVGNPRQTQRAVRAVCEYRGVVTDMRGQYDCEFIISLENGDRIVPVEIDRDFFNLYDGQLVILSYRPANIRIGCQRGTPATVTCIQEM